MNVQIGIVGKPNVGKSTFFKAATQVSVDIANYPFTTIDPNKGIAYVKIECVEKFFKVKCNPKSGFCIHGWRFVPVEIIDVAGLVPGAHEGRGLGNKFLDDLRQADVLIHIVDISGSTDEEGKPVPPGSYNPLKDVIWLEDELDYWFFSIIKRNLEKIKRKIATSKQNAFEILYNTLSGLKIHKDDLLHALKSLNLKPEEIPSIDDETLLKFSQKLRRTAKPVIIAANKVDIDTSEKFLKKMQEKFSDKIIIPTSAFAESILKELANKGKIRYIPGDSLIVILDNNLNGKYKEALDYIKYKVIEKYGSTGVQDVINVAVMNTLGLIPVWPVSNEKLTDSEGNVLPDVFLVRKGTTVKEFAYMIHTDLGEKFIRAREMKTKRTVGKDYMLQYNDVIMIVANV